MRGRRQTLSSALAWCSVSTSSFLRADGSERDALDSASTCLEAGLGALDTAVGDADTSRSSAWRYGLSEAKFRSGNMDRLVSMAVFKQTVDAGSFAAAARHFGIRPERAGHHARGGETHLGGRLWSGGRRR